MFYNKFTAYRARLERLYGFLLSTEERHSTQQPDIAEVSDGLTLEQLTLFRHNGEVLLSGIDISLKSGDSLLIRGPSGCGKTSLLRTLAGLWPFGSSGSVSRPPHDDILFLPQRPYTPQGTLREAICYPDIDKHHPDLVEAMNACRLDYLTGKLDKADDWQHKLSPGELQRIAFIRALLARPKVVLLDEATAALDEATEALLYRTLKQHLPESIIVSIGHRSTLNEFHNLCIDVGNVAC